MPGKQSWVQACGATGVFSHELGHNLSLHHASTPNSEYGDGSDPMGGARMVDHNGANRTMAGWMPAGSVLDVGTGQLVRARDGVDQCAVGVAAGAAHRQARQPRVLLRRACAQAMNLDAGLSSAYLDNVSVHRATGTLPARTYLLQNLADRPDVQRLRQRHLDHQPGRRQRHRDGRGRLQRRQLRPHAAGRQHRAVVADRRARRVGRLRHHRDEPEHGDLRGVVVQHGAGAARELRRLVLGADAGDRRRREREHELDGEHEQQCRRRNLHARRDGDREQRRQCDDARMPPRSSTSTRRRPWSTSPARRRTRSCSGRVGIAATASDDSALRAVEFYVDEVLIGRDTGPPFAANWNSRKAAAGLHLIRVRAIDAAGNVTDQTISMSVNASASTRATRRIVAQSGRTTSSRRSSPPSSIATVAAARTFGLAWYATESPAAAIIGRSLAPSPTAIDARRRDAERGAGLEQHLRLLGAVADVAPRLVDHAGR